MKQRRDRTELLLREPNLYKAFLILALPVFGANFIKAFNELVDTYFIGQIANSVAAQAGVSLSWPLLNIFASFQAGFGVAGHPSARPGKMSRVKHLKYGNPLRNSFQTYGIPLKPVSYTHLDVYKRQDKGVAMKRDVYALLSQTGLCCRLAR